jgi:xylulokinase
MLLLGIDIGTSSVKVSVVDAQTQRTIITVQHPETEREIKSVKPGWAEQHPAQWWSDTKNAILKAHAAQAYDPKDIVSIGIAYQMHGLVVVDKNHKPLRDAIIWCDSRAVEYGEAAFNQLGKRKILSSLLNSPGNFTASKLAWIKENEKEIYDQIYKIMLPGDYIAMELTGSITTTVSALSEGIFWNFKHRRISTELLSCFGFTEDVIPKIHDVFSTHGTLLKKVADELNLSEGTPITYKAGDQPNNALSLNVMNPGEVATTAGTSGVIYAVTDKLLYDKRSRVNTFAHVNYKKEEPRLGVLLCINGTGIMTRWARDIMGNGRSYKEMNERADAIAVGSNGLLCFPFGNGAERMLENKLLNAHFNNIDLNTHSAAHMYRAVGDGIAFAFRYGLDIMRDNGLQPSVVKAGKANMFLNDVFSRAFVNATGLALELYQTEGSTGAALGGGIGAGIYKNPEEAFMYLRSVQTLEPGRDTDAYEEVYHKWLHKLKEYLKKSAAT